MQRILGNHPQIYTVSEPWVMLHPLYALRATGHEAEYNARVASSALRDFLDVLPRGKEEYWRGMRAMYSSLYNCALEQSGSRYFLDKTPRYYFVIPELRRVFPEAHFIILLRNPLAVLCSILNTWVQKDWSKVWRFAHDLVAAPGLLLRGIELLGTRASVVHYEQLVRSPDEEVCRICQRLGLDFVPDMVDYGLRPDPGWQFGDQIGIREHNRPDSEGADKWVKALDDPQVWRLSFEYLQLLGHEVVTEMGYHYEGLQRVLDAQRPHPMRVWRTYRLYWLLKKRTEHSRRIRILMSLIDRLGNPGADTMLPEKGSTVETSANADPLDRQPTRTAGL